VGGGTSGNSVLPGGTGDKVSSSSSRSAYTRVRRCHFSRLRRSSFAVAKNIYLRLVLALLLLHLAPRGPSQGIAQTGSASPARIFHSHHRCCSRTRGRRRINPAMILERSRFANRVGGIARWRSRFDRSKRCPIQLDTRSWKSRLPIIRTLCVGRDSKVLRKGSLITRGPSSMNIIDARETKRRSPPGNQSDSRMRSIARDSSVFVIGIPANSRRRVIRAILVSSSVTLDRLSQRSSRMSLRENSSGFPGRPDCSRETAAAFPALRSALVLRSRLRARWEKLWRDRRLVLSSSRGPRIIHALYTSQSTLSRDFS